MMFGDIVSMIGTYEQRKVALHQDGQLMISTARVTDAAHPYETAVEHPDYNNGKMVIVEAYDTKAAAEAGHQRWLALMTGDTLPSELHDCGNSEVSQLCEMFGNKMVFPRSN